MSDLVIDSLLEEALSYIANDELASTPLEGMLEADIANKDYETLWSHIIQARELLND